ncbi:MAG: hypothetical protein SPK80_00145 [Bacteroidales bacterium]|nr:hypothetical protein [Bacteroidales bacterium]
MARKKNIEQQPAQKMRQLQVQPSVEVGEVAIYTTAMNWTRRQPVQKLHKFVMKAGEG